MSKTKDNLLSAFAGESQANRKYLAFAKKADQEGFSQAAKLFRAAAEAETVHAHAHLRVLREVKSTAENLKTLHKTIKKVEEDIESFSFNTSVSTFMIAVNELSAQKCSSRAILEPLLVLVSPYAPHIAEELWQAIGHNSSISFAPFPEFNPAYLVEATKVYPISFNGKMRFTLELSTDMSKEAIEEAVMAHEKTQAQLQGRSPKKVIVVPGKIVNIVG